MESKIVFGLVLSVILGGVVGFGLSYGMLNGQIESLRSELRAISTDLTNVSGTTISVRDDVDALKIELMGLRSDFVEMNETLDDLPTEWTTLDYVTLNNTVVELTDLITFLESNVTTADVQGELHYVYTDLGMGGDRHEIDAIFCNFGTKMANNTQINLTWVLDGVDYVYETINLGEMTGHSIITIDTEYNFDASNRVITFSYNVTWDNV